MTFQLPRVAALLFFSGACALIYQVAWFRELRLIFGASTAASAAVLAVFMGGLGAGGAFLGKRADRAKNPLVFYAHLEIFVAVSAAATPALVWLAQAIYLGIGGSSSLGSFGATLMRLVLSVFVLAPSTIAMGGTLPAAAKSVERESPGRQRVAALYGVNTFGAVTGAVAANFLFLEVFGTRLTLWLACLINVLTGLVARTIARSVSIDASSVEADAPAEDAPAAPKTVEDKLRAYFPPAAAGVAGFAFMLMELVWYRMLAPLLGGSSYTFGLILAVALVGIGIGGALYARSTRPSTLALFAVTCTLEALAIGIPFGLGDRIAAFTLIIRPLATYSFTGSILAWTLVTAIVVLPAAIVSGYQFPAIIGLYGKGSKSVGGDVGKAYLANTIGAILGSIGGGFGLLPKLTAPTCWQLVAVLLVLTATVAIALHLRESGRGLSTALVGASGIGAILVTLLPHGPTAFWRHGGIGAGRADTGNADAREVTNRADQWQTEIAWEEDGLESSVALGNQNGYVFIVNGKADGHIFGDAGTQIMSGLLAALLHPNPKTALVVGLGTGSTAGWLGAVPSMDRVDVVELEPSILRVARDCALGNQRVMENPKVHTQLGDAREALRTTDKRYDVIFSEPSNPYRAGISSLFTVEYYEAAATRLNPEGMFVQWVQGYEVDAFVIATAAITLHQVFPQVTLWESMSGDFLMIAKNTPLTIDVDRVRTRLREEPYASAARVAWRTASAEGVLARFIADSRFVQTLADHRLGTINTDDQNFLEFAFARHVGSQKMIFNEVSGLAIRLGMATPPTTGAYDPMHVFEEKMLGQVHDNTTIDPQVEPAPRPLVEFGQFLARISRSQYTDALKAWKRLDRAPRSYAESAFIAELSARTGSPELPELLPHVLDVAERELLRGIWLARKGDNAAAVSAFEQGFVLARENAWMRGAIMIKALEETVRLGGADPGMSRRLLSALVQPFAAEAFRESRIRALIQVARSTRDPKLCVSTLDGLGRLPRQRLYLVTRAGCYADAGDPRAAEAEQALGEFLLPAATFGMNIPTPPGVLKSAPPARPGPAMVPRDAGPGDEDAAASLRPGDGGRSAIGTDGSAATMPLPRAQDAAVDAR